MTLVANQPMYIPRSQFISIVVVGEGANVADRRIVDVRDEPRLAHQAHGE